MLRRWIEACHGDRDATRDFFALAVCAAVTVGMVVVLVAAVVRLVVNGPAGG